MICIIGTKDTVTGFNLAGIKNSYDNPKDAKDEKIFIVDKTNADRFTEELETLEDEGKIIIKLD
ncbi:MAG: hypothetical protein K0B07_00110 [DPANN group archaeon]|nr:hypothetical protein [DPANN group archaeon]